jgi:hypothetical protein
MVWMAARASSASIGVMFILNSFRVLCIIEYSKGVFSICQERITEWLPIRNIQPVANVWASRALPSFSPLMEAV